MGYFEDFERADTLSDIFEIIKSIVWKKLRKSRAGLELGLLELGNASEGLLGAYYVSGSNMIVMNETPLKRIQETNPDLLKPYIFSVLLHEYLHSLGYFNEKKVKELVYEICCQCFGRRSIISEFARDLRQFFPYIIYPSGSPQIESKLRKVKDFDKSNIRYIG